MGELMICECMVVIYILFFEKCFWTEMITLFSRDIFEVQLYDFFAFF